MVTKVMLSKLARKQFEWLPGHIKIKLTAWVEEIESVGISEVRKIPGHHDEPLKGDRFGQRSIRLNRSYRAIYILKGNNHLEFIVIEEVHKHDY